MERGGRLTIEVERVTPVDVPSPGIGVLIELNG